MAIVKSPLFTEMRKSIGESKFSTIYGRIIASAKGNPPTFKDPRVKETRDLRVSGFGGSGELSGVLKEVLRLGYREVPRAKYPVNLFVEDNATMLCTSTRGKDGKIVKEYDYPSMKVAGGTLDTVTVAVTYTEDTRKFLFAQDGEVIIGGRAYSDEKVYACVFEGKQKKVALVTLRERGEAGSTSFTLPAGWDVADTYIYAFAVSAGEERSSPSTRVYPAPTVEEEALARMAEIERLEEERQKATRAQLAAECHTRMIEAVFRAQEAAEKAREEALASGKSLALAEIEATTARDIVLEEARDAEDKLEREIALARKQAAGAKEAREKAKRNN